MNTWYNAEIDTINYNWDNTTPDVLKLTKVYKEVKFTPSVLTQVQIKINQQPGSKMIEHLSNLMRIKVIEEPSDPFIP